MNQEYINSVTLEYLLNPLLYNKINDQKNASSNLLFQDIKFYRKRICQITKDMCKGEFIDENGIDYNLILAPTWEQNNNKTYFTSCSIDEGYDKNALKIFNLITNNIPRSIFSILGFSFFKKIAEKCDAIIEKWEQKNTDSVSLYLLVQEQDQELFHCLFLTHFG